MNNFKNISPSFQPRTNNVWQNRQIKVAPLPATIQEQDCEEDIQIILHNSDKDVAKPPINLINQFNNVTIVPREKPQNLYSKFCSNLSKEGVCTYNNCTFAHTIDQYSPLKCRRDCGYRSCVYFHSWENIQEYISRNNISVPEVIEIQSICEKAKLYKTEEMKNYKSNPLTTQVKLECNLSKVNEEVKKINGLGYKNINLQLWEKDEVRIYFVTIQDQINFINDNIQNFTFYKLDQFLSKEKFRLSILFPDVNIYIRNLIKNNTEEVLLQKDIYGEVNTITFISKLQEIIQNQNVGKYTLRKINLVNSENGLEFDINIDTF